MDNVRAKLEGKLQPLINLIDEIENDRKRQEGISRRVKAYEDFHHIGKLPDNKYLLSYGVSFYKNYTGLGGYWEAHLAIDPIQHRTEKERIFVRYTKHRESLDYFIRFNPDSEVVRYLRENPSLIGDIDFNKAKESIDDDIRNFIG